MNNLKLQTHGKAEQMFWFLTGGAGCGKTKTTKVLYEVARRYYNRIPNSDHTKDKIPEVDKIYLIIGDILIEFEIDYF